jgi:DNA-binding transcriptional regulator YdaS (Cro superfamily)
LTHKTFEKKIKRMFRTQRKAAEALGVTQQSVSHWCTGRYAVPTIIEKFMQCLEEAKEEQWAG